MFITREEAYSVSDVNKIAKYILENSTPEGISVIGEISNLTYHVSGHMYFTIKDERACLKCVAFSYKARGIPSDLKHGEEVKVFGKLTLYEASGQYQALCEAVERRDKKGDLYANFLKLKDRLSKEGCFDDINKKEIPLSFHIGVVTSEKGAVIRDIISTARAKFENVNITLYPATVQGEGADLQIIAGIEVLSQIEDIDTIIIGRGGGSFEDLNCFNSEELAYTIFNCKKPIISAVGHETDFVISDWVADRRAATPTQAADMAVPSKNDLLQALDMRSDSLNKRLMNFIQTLKESLNNKANSYVLKNFLEQVSERKLSLQSAEKNALQVFLHKLEMAKAQLMPKIQVLKSLNPDNVIKRGYTMTLKEGKVIHAKDLKEGDRIETRFKDGKIKSEVV